MSAVYGRSKVLKNEDVAQFTTIFKDLGISVTFDGVDKTPVEVEL
jgi:hypothetical protein